MNAGIGGFAVRTRGTRPRDEDGWEGLASQATTPTPTATPENISLTPQPGIPPTTPTSEEKPKRKPPRKKPKNRIMESFPVYIQVHEMCNNYEIYVSCKKYFVLIVNIYIFLGSIFWSRAAGLFQRAGPWSQ
jgi:hypothetical protein